MAVNPTVAVRSCTGSVQLIQLRFYIVYVHCVPECVSLPMLKVKCLLTLPWPLGPVTTLLKPCLIGIATA